jgi:two-component system NtrC family sensor kinase
VSSNIGATIVGVLLIGLGTIWGVTGLRQDLSGALGANRQLRGAYEVGFQVAMAKVWLGQPQRSPERAVAALNGALVKLGEHGDAARHLEAVREAIHRAQDQLNADPNAAVRSLDLALGNVARFSTEARQSIVDHQAAADATHRTTLALVALLSVAVVLITIVIGARQYRSVIRPLAHLNDAVGRMAKGKFEQRLAERGDVEFVQLSDHFNQMAGQLDDLYRSLERRVAEKSKELVRSERLASVGYLAAGVAHEINNPLGIIAGYGERALHHLERDVTTDTTGRVTSSLRVICDEAFRAKEITDRLLSLARPASEGRSVVPLAKVVREVVDTLCGLAKFAKRKVIVKADDDAQLVVHGSAGELKQVLLNLLVNALEATDADGRGQVIVTMGRAGEWINLTVTDNGRGMTPQTLDRVFEPFFTERRGERSGTGLGLSIAHAIVSNHGGSISVASDGPDTGSTFTVRLPAVMTNPFTSEAVQTG